MSIFLKEILRNYEENFVLSIGKLFNLQGILATLLQKNFNNV